MEDINYNGVDGVFIPNDEYFFLKKFGVLYINFIYYSFFNVVQLL